jgi:hypothetical protein
MKNILKNRMALSTVVTTLIILVVSVLLAGVVTYFAINVTSTRVQEESLQISKLHVWYDSGSTSAQAAFLIMNTGGRDVVINKLTVRGQEATWADVYTIVASPTDDLAFSTTLTTDHKYCTITDGASTPQDAMTAATGDITLQSGNSLVVYIHNPDSITINDIGLTVGVTVFTSQAMYYQEANVQST